MRLALALILAVVCTTATARSQQLPAFFIRTTTTPAAPARNVNFNLSDARCEHVLEPAILAAQIYDVINTGRQLRRYPLSRESDWWTSMFAGGSGRNLAGIALGIALNDFIKWKLTAHSAPLRCLAETNQFTTTLESIAVTHPR